MEIVPFSTHTHDEEPGATTTKSGRTIIQKFASPYTRCVYRWEKNLSLLCG